MPGSHNSNYCAKSLKKNKVQSHNITKLLKRTRKENTANKTHKFENKWDGQQIEQYIVEQLEEDCYLPLQVSVAVCTTLLTTFISTKSDLTKIEQL